MPRDVHLKYCSGPRQCAREYSMRSTGTGVFCVVVSAEERRADKRAAVLGNTYSAPLLFVSDRLTARQFVTDRGAAYGQCPPDSAPVNRPGLVQSVDGRPVVSTGVGVTLVVAGAILRFAVASRVAYVLNAHVAGVIVMLAGVFALLLSLLVWGPLNRRRSRSGGHA